MAARDALSQSLSNDTGDLLLVEAECNCGTEWITYGSFAIFMSAMVVSKIFFLMSDRIGTIAYALKRCCAIGDFVIPAVCLFSWAHLFRYTLFATLMQVSKIRRVLVFVYLALPLCAAMLFIALVTWYNEFSTDTDSKHEIEEGEEKKEVQKVKKRSFFSLLITVLIHNVLPMICLAMWAILFDYAIQPKFSQQTFTFAMFLVIGSLSLLLCVIVMRRPKWIQLIRADEIHPGWSAILALAELGFFSLLFIGWPSADRNGAIWGCCTGDLGASYQWTMIAVQISTAVFSIAVLITSVLVVLLRPWKHATQHSGPTINAVASSAPPDAKEIRPSAGGLVLSNRANGVAPSMVVDEASRPLVIQGDGNKVEVINCQSNYQNARMSVDRSSGGNTATTNTNNDNSRRVNTEVEAGFSFLKKTPALR